MLVLSFEYEICQENSESKYLIAKLTANCFTLWWISILFHGIFLDTFLLLHTSFECLSVAWDFNLLYNYSLASICLVFYSYNWNKINVTRNDI